MRTMGSFRVFRCRNGVRALAMKQLLNMGIRIKRMAESPGEQKSPRDST